MGKFPLKCTAYLTNKNIDPRKGKKVVRFSVQL